MWSAGEERAQGRGTRGSFGGRGREREAGDGGRKGSWRLKGERAKRNGLKEEVRARAYAQVRFSSARNERP